MQESILRRLAGWTGGSDMPAVYIHVRNKDVEQSQLALHGKAVAQRHLSQSTLTKECPTCHKEIPVEVQFCDNCEIIHERLIPTCLIPKSGVPKKNYKSLAYKVLKK